jgi:hypothetical protein
MKGDGFDASIRHSCQLDLGARQRSLVEDRLRTCRFEGGSWKVAFRGRIEGAMVHRMR